MKQTAKWLISTTTTTTKKKRKNQLKCFVYHLYNFVRFSQTHKHTQSVSPLSIFHRFPFDFTFFSPDFGNLQPPSVDSRLYIRRIIILNE